MIRLPNVPELRSVMLPVSGLCFQERAGLGRTPSQNGEPVGCVIDLAPQMGLRWESQSDDARPLLQYAQRTPYLLYDGVNDRSIHRINQEPWNRYALYGNVSFSYGIVCKSFSANSGSAWPFYYGSSGSDVGFGLLIAKDINGDASVLFTSGANSRIGALAIPPGWNRFTVSYDARGGQMTAWINGRNVGTSVGFTINLPGTVFANMGTITGGASPGNSGVAALVYSASSLNAPQFTSLDQWLAERQPVE